MMDTVFTNLPKKISVFGLGYSAKYYVTRWLDRHRNNYSDNNLQLFATVTNPDTFPEKNKDFLNFLKVHSCEITLFPLKFDDNYLNIEIISSIKNTLSFSEAILISIPPNETGCPVAKLFSDTIIQNKQLSWLGYLSSLAVYGDSNGEWIDEKTPTNPTELRGKNRVLAEQQWLTLFQNHAVPTHIFRLAGIYGAGRNIWMDLLNQKARLIIKEGHVFNRIHVEDIAQLLLTSVQKPRSGAIYNVCDNYPASSQEVMEYVAKNFNLPIPEPTSWHDLPDNSMLKSFYLSCKRVSSQLIQTELNAPLYYPNYKEGYDSGL